MVSGSDWLGSDYLDLARLVREKRSLPEFYQSVQQVLERRMAAENMFVALAELPEGIRFPYYVDEIEAEDEFRIYAKEGLTAHVLDTGRTAWIGRETGLLESVGFIGPRPSDWIGVPLLDRAGATFGVLTVQTYQRGLRYREDDCTFVEYAAAQLSIAIQLQRQERELAMNRIAALVDETTDMDELYRRIHEIVASLIPTAQKSFVIARIDEAASRFRTVYWRDDRDDWDAYEWPLEKGMSGYICNVTGQSFIYEEGRTPLPPEIQRIGAPPRFWLGAPLYSGCKIIGVVFTQSYQDDRPITREDEATLACVCPHIAQAIGRTAFFELNYRSSLRG